MGDRLRAATAKPSDAALMAAIQHGDRAALAELYRRLAPLAYRTALSICHERECAQDAVQDGFVSIWSSRATYAPAPRLGADVGERRSSVTARSISPAGARATGAVERLPAQIAQQPASDDVPGEFAARSEAREIAALIALAAAGAARGNPPRLLRRAHARADRAPARAPARHRQGAHAPRPAQAALRPRDLTDLCGRRARPQRSVRVRVVVRYDLAGKVALVTGSARGIGFATARALIARGASVVLVDLDERRGRQRRRPAPRQPRARDRRRRHRPRRDAACRRSGGRALRRPRRRRRERRHRLARRDLSRDPAGDLRARARRQPDGRRADRRRAPCRRSSAARGTSS